MKKTQFLVSFVLVALAFIYSNMSRAAIRCEGHTKPLTGCFVDFNGLRSEQAQVNAVDRSIDLKKSLNTLFAHVNGKLLHYVHPVMGEYTVKFTIRGNSMDVQIDGRPARDADICYSTCPGSKKVSWSSPKNGSFKRIPNGLKIGKYEFVVKK